MRRAGAIGWIVMGLVLSASVALAQSKPRPRPAYRVYGRYFSAVPVPMRHATCGARCKTHVVARGWRYDAQEKLELACSPGSQIDYFAYKARGGRVVKVVEGGAQSRQTRVATQLFTTAELERTCQRALGGRWEGPRGHKRRAKEVKTTIRETIEVWGRCSGDAKTKKQSHPAVLGLTCEDQS